MLLLEKCFLASGYNLFFAWTFLLAHCARYLGGRGIEQRRVHKLLLGLQALICVENTSLLLFFETLHVAKVFALGYASCNDGTFALAAGHDSCELGSVVHWDFFVLLRPVLLCFWASSGVGTIVQLETKVN